MKLQNENRQKLLHTLHQTLKHLKSRKIVMALPDHANFPPHLATWLAAQISPPLRQVLDTLQSQDFWWIDSEQGQKELLYESTSGLIWNAKPDTSKAWDNEKGNPFENQPTKLFSKTTTPSSTLKGLVGAAISSLISAQHEYSSNLCSIKGTKKPLATRETKVEWQLPDPEQLFSFAKNSKNPLREGDNNRLLNWHGWMTTEGPIDLDYHAPSPCTNGSGYLIACSSIAKIIACSSIAKTGEEFIKIAVENGWSLHSTKKNTTTDLLAPLKITPKDFFTYIDHRACRLPRLEPTQFTDPNKGLWELWGVDSDLLSEQGLRARNPAEDVKDWNIAIDFGTSSTVVAYDDNGQSKLLRIGVKDFLEAPSPEHYENPTVLEFIDFSSMLNVWQEQAYRPDVQWDDVRCSHEALHNLRNNETNPAVVASILCKIKQWALRQGTDRSLRIIDQRRQFEHEFAPLSARMPVKGKMLQVGTDDPFDPVELYAWFLGMNINWRGRGLFLRYYMTFPIAYPREVKENILAAFRRGLQRSLPAGLVEQPVFSNFSVEELASEPAAYAAAALPQLGLSPTSEGLAYAVFDFGGGTADFDFGYYRLPTPEEEDNGCEVVFEHFGNEGDRFLGGENLLENMAYLAFQHNLDICRKYRIAFSKPLDAKDFPGSELFLEHTQAAATNTLILVARLRPLWEKGELTNSSGIEKVALINRDGEKITCELAIPTETLHQYLEHRIEAGIQNFFVALKNAFADNLPAEVHVLLAGNSSRSRLVTEFFGLLSSPQEKEQTIEHPMLFARTHAYLKKLFGERHPAIIAYPPLPMDEQNLYRPTAKTGVALGLLRLCPGGVVDVINHAHRTFSDQAPFAHYVGRVRQSAFQPALRPGVPYHEWHEIGPPRDRVFNLFHSQTPRANTGEMHEGEPGLFKKRLDLAGDTSGKRVFVRAIAPGTIEYCTAASHEELLESPAPLSNLRRLELS